MTDGDPQGERWTSARRAAERAAETAAEFAAASVAPDQTALLEAVVRGTTAWAAAGDCDETATNAVRAAVLAATALWPDAEAAEAAWEQAADVVFGGTSDWRRSAVTAAFCDWVQHDAAAAATWRDDAQRRRNALPADSSGSGSEAQPPPDDRFVALCAKYADQFPADRSPKTWRDLAEVLALVSARLESPSSEIDEAYASALFEIGWEEEGRPALRRALAEQIATLSERQNPPSRTIDELLAVMVNNAAFHDATPNWRSISAKLWRLTARHDPPSFVIEKTYAAATGNALAVTGSDLSIEARRAHVEKIETIASRQKHPQSGIDEDLARSLFNLSVWEYDSKTKLSIGQRIRNVALRHQPPLYRAYAYAGLVIGRAHWSEGRKLPAYLELLDAVANCTSETVADLGMLEFLIETGFDPKPLQAGLANRGFVQDSVDAATRLWLRASPASNEMAANLGTAAVLTREVLERGRSAVSAASAWSSWLLASSKAIVGLGLTSAEAAGAGAIGSNAAQSAWRLEGEAGAELRRATESFLTAALAAAERCPDGPARLAAGWALTDARLRLQTRDEAAFRAALAAAEAERRERLGDPDVRGLYLPQVSRTLRLAVAASADETRSLEDRAAARRLAEAYAAVLPAHRLDAAVAAWSGAGAAAARAATAGLSRGPDPASRRTRAGPDEYRVQLCLDRDDPLLGAGITTLRDDGGTAESECTTFGAAHTDDLCKQADAAFEVFDLLQGTGWAAAGAAERRRRAAKALGCEDAELAPLSESEMRERLSRHTAGLLAPLADAFFGHPAAERLRGRRVFLTPPPEWTGLPLWSLPVADARGERTPLAELAREVVLCPLPGGVAAPAAGPTSGTAWLCTAEFDPREAAPANAACDRDAWLRSLGGECAVYRVGGGGAAAVGWAGRDTVHVTGHFDPAASSGGSRPNLADLIGESVRGAPPAEWVLEMCGAGRAEQGSGVRRWAAAVVLLATGARRVVAPTLQVAPGSSFCRAWFAAYYAARAAGTDATVAARLAYDGVGNLGTVLERPDRWMPFVVFGA